MERNTAGTASGGAPVPVPVPGTPPRTVLFVCPHGAGKSRLAAAFFNGVAPAGWRATSAGQHPGEAVSPQAVRLLAGTPVEPLLDLDPPRPIEAVTAPARIIGIDCDVAGASRWDLRQRQADDALRDELRTRAEALARELARERPRG